MLDAKAMKRRTFLAAGTVAPFAARAAEPYTAPPWEAPVLQLHDLIRAPVKISSIELLRASSGCIVRSTSTDGVTGITVAKGSLADAIPVLLRLVIPYFLNKDARDLEALVDGVYKENYKLAGQLFWVPVATVELSLFDLLGRTASKPVATLLGGARKTRIAAYLSGSVRETTAEEEVEIYARAAEITGARAAKFKIGGRMSRNEDPYPGRTVKLLELGRKRLGDDFTLYADANGSYDVRKGIEIGKIMESLHYGFYEEPCPWEQFLWTKAVKQGLKIPIAFGEQDSSLPLFEWMIDNRVFDIVQPDINYNGGLIRAVRVARMAAKAGLTILNHNTETGAAGAKILHFAAAMANFGPAVEWPWRTRPKPQPWYTPVLDITDGTIPLPSGPGFGLEYDPSWLKKAAQITRA
jgi:L-alanine-DL-glutamate epimerase-like enolase superfamily enzyme